MKKLFVFQNNDNPYQDELQCAYEKVSQPKERIALEDLSLDFLSREAVDVVVSNGLSTEWYLILKGLSIVTITMDSGGKYHELSDIVIDCLSTDDNRYFTGADYSVCNNGKVEAFNIDEIVNLIKGLDWNSKFFGFNVAYLSCMHLTENIIHKIDGFIKNNNIRLVEYLCNCHDRKSVRVAEANRFHFADIRLTFNKTIKQEETVSTENLTFNKASEHDIEKLKEKISTDFYKDSRYYFDGNFDIHKTKDFFQVWIEKAVRGEYDDECWCLYDNADPIVYCTLRYDKPKRAHIGLFGVDARYQGYGLGSKLLKLVNNVLFRQDIPFLNVVTQGRNYAAQRLYQSAGFRTETTQLWYHKWF